MLERIKKVLIEPKYFWIILAAVFIISRLATWGYPFDSDHWIFYYVGHNWLHGGSLYLTAWDHKPPLIFLFNGLMSVALGSNIVWHRILFTLLSFVDIYLFWRLLKAVAPKLFATVISPSSTVIPAKAGIQPSSVVIPTEVEESLSKTTKRYLQQGRDDRVGLFVNSGLLLYVFWRNLSQFTSSGNNTENFGLIFFLGMLLSYLSFRDDRKWRKILFSGTCFSVLFFLKGNFLLLGIPIGILMISDYWKELRNFLLYSFLFVLPVILQSLLWIGYFWKAGSLREFFVATFLFSSKYASSAWTGDVSNNIALLLTLLVFLLPFLALALVYLCDIKKQMKNETYWLVGLTALSGLGLTLGVGSFYPYYFLIAMPVFVIIITYAIFSLRQLRSWRRWLIVLGIAVSMLVSLAISMKQLVNTFSGNAKAEAGEYQQIANYVDAHTTAEDKVFDYDYGATFYQLAHRDSGSRFISASVLLLDYRDHYGFDLDKTFISDMEKSQTKYIVVYRDKDNLYYQNKPVVQYFDSHYHPEKTFTKFEVLRRN